MIKRHALVTVTAPSRRRCPAAPRAQATAANTTTDAQQAVDAAGECGECHAALNYSKSA
jgi:hypothetical protein